MRLATHVIPISSSLSATFTPQAQSLIMDLTWLNTSFHERWRRIIFTPSAPVSGRWKALMRLLFAISFFLCCTVVWIGVRGAYRAYRHKLVWGERLMS